MYDLWKKQKKIDLTKFSKQELLKYNKLWSKVVVPHVPFDNNYIKIRNIKYNVDFLKKDLGKAIQNTEWQNKSKDKRWKSITLKSNDGRDQSFLKLTKLGRGEENNYKYTKAIDGCEYFKQILDELPTDVYLVRILLLEEGGVIDFHTDEIVFENNKDIMRCHIPIITDPKIKFRIGFPLASRINSNIKVDDLKYKKALQQQWNARVLHEKHLEEGYIYYTNVNTLHSVVNNSNISRYHLCIDMRPPEWMEHILNS